MWRSTSRSRVVSWSSSGSLTSTMLPPKASRTNPARRGENTASPPCTVRIAVARSSGDTVLVTYPRAGADHLNDVGGRVGHRQCQEADVGVAAQAGLDNQLTAAAREVDVEKDDVGPRAR